MRSLGFLITLVLGTSLVLLGCGSFGTGKKDAGSAPSASTSTTDSLTGKPSYKSGGCEGDVGCIRGFISHGMRLTMAPKDDGVKTKVNGDKLQLAAASFNDAQDFGDRFDTAFLVPLLPEGKRDQYNINLTPTVRRDNFAAGFELYAEGEEANDDKVQMQGEGNFVLGDMKPFGSAVLRVVKTFKIEIERKPDATGDIPVVERAVTCLEIEAQVSDIKIDAGKATSVGGLRNFSFYYTESSDLCVQRSNTESQARTVPGTDLPAVGPKIP